MHPKDGSSPEERSMVARACAVMRQRPKEKWVISALAKIIGVGHYSLSIAMRHCPRLVCIVANLNGHPHAATLHADLGGPETPTTHGRITAAQARHLAEIIVRERRENAQRCHA
jgi:hypothetical protein